MLFFSLQTFHGLEELKMDLIKAHKTVLHKNLVLDAWIFLIATRVRVFLYEVAYWADLQGNKKISHFYAVSKQSPCSIHFLF